jgi:hypothetical protein
MGNRRLAQMVDIVSRAKGILIEPAQEWPVIAAEPATTQGLIVEYAAILSAIPAVLGLVGTLMLGGTLGLPFPVGRLVVHSVLAYILGLGSLWILGKIIQQLAPMFGGTNNEIAAMKLSVYPPTASWVAGILLVIPFLGWILVLVGTCYSIYLFYIGAPVVAGVPRDKVVPFTVAVAVCSIVVSFLIGWVALLA